MCSSSVYLPRVSTPLKVAAENETSLLDAHGRQVFEGRAVTPLEDGKLAALVLCGGVIPSLLCHWAESLCRKSKNSREYVPFYTTPCQLTLHE